MALLYTFAHQKCRNTACWPQRDAQRSAGSDSRWRSTGARYSCPPDDPSSLTLSRTIRGVPRVRPGIPCRRHLIPGCAWCKSRWAWILYLDLRPSNLTLLCFPGQTWCTTASWRRDSVNFFDLAVDSKYASCCFQACFNFLSTSLLDYGLFGGAKRLYFLIGSHF